MLIIYTHTFIVGHFQILLNYQKWTNQFTNAHWPTFCNLLHCCEGELVNSFNYCGELLKQIEINAESKYLHFQEDSTCNTGYR